MRWNFNDSCWGIRWFQQQIKAQIQCLLVREQFSSGPRGWFGWSLVSVTGTVQNHVGATVKVHWETGMLIWTPSLCCLYSVAFWVSWDVLTPVSWGCVHTQHVLKGSPWLFNDLLVEEWPHGDAVACAGEVESVWWGGAGSTGASFKMCVVNKTLLLLYFSCSLMAPFKEETLNRNWPSCSLIIHINLLKCSFSSGLFVCVFLFKLMWQQEVEQNELLIEKY